MFLNGSDSSFNSILLCPRAYRTWPAAALKTHKALWQPQGESKSKLYCLVSRDQGAFIAVPEFALCLNGRTRLILDLRHTAGHC